MAETSLTFPRAEFEARTTTLQRHMADAGIDALLLTSAADVFYLTGFLTRFWESPARPWFIIVPAKGTPVAVIPAIGAALMGQTWIADIRTWDAPDPQDDGVSLLADTLADICPANGKIGTPMGLETTLRMPLADFARLKDRLSPRVWVDGTGPTQRTREVKSPAEIAKIRTICQIAGAAFDRVLEIVSEAPRIDNVFRGFQSALLSEGADWVSYTAGGAGPGGYDDVISPPGAVPLREGDVLMLDTGAVKDGYFCDFDRNYAIGPPSVESQRAHDALYAATDFVLGALRPGMTAAYAHYLLSAALKERGATPGGGRLGHGLGVTLTEWPSFTPKDTTELRAGMVLTLEPSAILESGRMLVHEENIVLRDSGPELLSPRAPADLPVIAL